MALAEFMRGGEGMPSVSPPSDGGYNYYSQRISDLEDQMGEEARQARTREEERFSSLENNYKKELAKKEADMDETARNMQDSYSRNLASERESAKSDVDALKSQMYGRNGRTRQEADINAAERKRLNDSVVELDRNAEARRRLSENSVESRVQKSLEDNEKRIEDNARVMTDAHRQETQ